jgi:hypothetical protein
VLGAVETGRDQGVNVDHAAALARLTWHLESQVMPRVSTSLSTRLVETPNRSDRV